MKKPKLVVANWKMHLDVQQASLLVNRLDKRVKVHREVEVVIAPNYLCLQPIAQEVDRRKFKLASQDGYFIDEGAYTGQVSFSQMRGLIDYSIVGHSERRRYFHESLEEVRDKMAAAIRNGITPILCVGETKPERAQGETKQVLHDQIVTALANLTSQEADNLVVAYEPVWAIGGHEPAKPDAIAKAVGWVRYQIEELFGKTVAENVRILYGGSDEPEFVNAIMSIDGVDGLLVGHASLNYQQFAEIIDGVYKSCLTKAKKKD